MKTNLTIILLLISIISYSQRPEMVFVEGGSFKMGNMASDYINEKPLHKVTLDDFYIAKYEVTFDEFDLFCNATGYEKPRDGGFGREKKPLINVSWEGAIKYCNWMSSRFNLEKVYELKIDSTGMKIKSVNWEANGFRLPTEAEWEYAAKGGKKGGTMHNLVDIAWFADNSDAKPHEVGQLEPNGLGIYDIFGNAYEWCWDYYSDNYYSNSPENNPKGPESGEHRVYRGGGFNSSQDFLNVTRRFNLSPTLDDGMIGIRLVRSKE